MQTAPIHAGTPPVAYNDKVVRQFAIMTVVWGIVGMLVGVFIAAATLLAGAEFRRAVVQLWPLAAAAHQRGDFRLWRLRAVGDLILRRAAHLPCSTFRRQTGRVRLLGLAGRHPAAAITLPLGITQGKEYAELEWPIDLLITFVWVAYAVVFFGTMAIGAVKHIYVANWFYAAFIITIAVLHIFNNLAIPVSADQVLRHLLRRRRCDDGMVVWPQRGRIFPTAGFLGMMYYFVPKQAQRPDLLLPSFGSALLGADIRLHVGRPASSALHLAARLGPVDRHGLLGVVAGALVGRHDQRHHDAVRSMAQAPDRPDPQVPDRLALVLRHVDL